MAAKTPEPPKDSRTSGAQPTSAQAAAPGNAVAKVAAGSAPASTASTASTTTPGPSVASTSRSGVGRRNQAGGVAAVIAVCSLLVAMGSTVIAIYSLNVARQAKSRAAAAASALDRATTPSRTPGAAGTSTAKPTASPTVAPTPGPTYLAELVKTDLRIPAAEGCASIFVDVDTLQIGQYAGHEFYLSSCLGPQSLRIDQTAMAATAPASPSPESCASLLASPAASPQLVLPVYSGLTFCLLTSRDETVNQGLPQRLAIVEIRSLNQDHSLTAVVSTYRVPA